MWSSCLSSAVRCVLRCQIKQSIHEAFYFNSLKRGQEPGNTQSVSLLRVTPSHRLFILRGDGGKEGQRERGKRKEEGKEEGREGGKYGVEKGEEEGERLCNRHYIKQRGWIQLFFETFRSHLGPFRDRPEEW